MSEAPRTSMSTAELRRRAYALIKQCWKTLLIAAVLMHLFSWVESAVKAYGDHAGRQAYDAHMAAFIAENPPPEDEEARIEWAYFDAWLAQREAEDLYNGLYRPYEVAANAISFANMLLSTIIAVRLCRGLLTALRGGECTPHILLSGWARTSTTCWLAIQITLRICGWSLLPMIVPILLLGALGDWATLVSMALVLLVAGWASLHYALSRFHLADDTSGLRTASMCLRFAVDDADAFGLWNMCKVLLPAIGLLLLSIAMTIIGILVPAVSVPAAILVALADLLCLSMKYACYACIYDEMRQRIRAAEEAIPSNEGLARARALSGTQDA